jgi:hypothetical protein
MVSAAMAMAAMEAATMIVGDEMNTAASRQGILAVNTAEEIPGNKKGASAPFLFYQL